MVARPHLSRLPVSTVPPWARAPLQRPCQISTGTIPIKTASSQRPVIIIDFTKHARRRFLYAKLVFLISVALPDTSTTSTGLELEQQLMSSSNHLHNGHNTMINENSVVPKYVTGPECLSGGPRSLSDSSNGESPIGNDDLYVGAHNGHAAAMGTTPSSFHHHHMHHHSAGNSYHNSHYPMLPASLFYSQLYHSGSNVSRQMLDETEQQRCSNAAASQRVTNDNVAVWRPY